MSTYSLLSDLLPELEAYQLEVGSKATVSDFGQWLSRKHQQMPDILPSDGDSPFQPFVGAPQARYMGMPDAGSAIARLVVVLYRYAKRYGKMALEGSPFSSLDEATFMATVINEPGLSKMDLITKNTQEKPLGMQIINRLISNGYLVQRDHPETKRSKALFATEAGMGALFSFLPKMQMIGRIVVADLPAHLQDHLFELLQHLDKFHEPMFNERKVQHLDQVMAALP